MDYSPNVYRETQNPWKGGAVIPNAVPGYWEDMVDVFSTAPFYWHLEVNPSYGIQRYPITGICPGMALPNITGNFFYRRSFTWTACDAGVTLYFGGVQNAVSVWLNDTYLGRYEGYSAPIEMAIPQELLISGENTLVFSVSNIELTGYKDEMISGLANRASNLYTGGIYGDVELRVYESALRDVAVLIAEDCSKALVHVDSADSVQFQWEVLDGEKVIQSGCDNGDFQFCTAELERWSPENPKLYTLRLTCGTAVLEQVFGVRRFRNVDVQAFLNGKPYYLRGICEHFYYPETIHPCQDIAFYRNEIKILKELGFNFIRCHTHIPAEAYMQAADELGMLVQVESPIFDSIEEWERIITHCRRHPSVVIYCCGNEIVMDEAYLEHARECARLVHEKTDALFSLMSALGGIEYNHGNVENKDELKTTPFTHHPARLKTAEEFSDVFNSYTLGRTSYSSLKGDPAVLDEQGAIYHKPRFSHEIGIQGTYTDLSLKGRYEGNRIGATEMFSSIEKHLESKGLLKRAPLYFKNSAQWQRRVRKHNFETVRSCKYLAGYDFLGPIDTHWHTFGYDVGMMNEFYELKPGETIRNVRMYNGETVLLTDLGTGFNFAAGENLSFNLLVSHYGSEILQNPELNLRLTADGKCIFRQRLTPGDVVNGAITKLCHVETTLPLVEKPEAMKLYVTLEAGDTFVENEWELYLFPKPEPAEKKDLLICEQMTQEELVKALEQGKNVVLLGSEPFKSLPTTYQIALAGRTSGNLATVIEDHPLTRSFPHDGFCGWQFRQLMEEGKAVCFESNDVPFKPIIEVVSTHKCAIRQAALFEFQALKGKVLVCSFRFAESDPAAVWLKAKLLSYAASDAFEPETTMSLQQLEALMNAREIQVTANTNLAFDPAVGKGANRKK